MLEVTNWIFTEIITGIQFVLQTLIHQSLLDLEAEGIKGIHLHTDTIVILMSPYAVNSVTGALTSSSRDQCIVCVYH